MGVRSGRLKNHVSRIKKIGIRLVFEHNSSSFGELPQMDNSVNIKSIPTEFVFMG